MILHRPSFPTLLTLSLRLLSPSYVQFARSDSVYIASADYTAGAYGAGPFQSYFSANSTPSIWNFVQPQNKTTSISAGYLFTAPGGSSTVTPGPLIYDSNGFLVWDGTAFGETLVFQVETYQGEPVIVSWSGDELATGVGNGTISIINNKYELIATVTANLTGITGPTLSDFHETRITTSNTLMTTAYQPIEYDLSAFGGPATGYLSNSLFQEINITTGEALFTWSAIDHVSPSECYSPIGSTGTSVSNLWDYFHINSIDLSDDGNYLVSSRHCYTIYFINGTTGDIIWQMGGMNSSFAMGDGANYSWQHHARWVTKNDTGATMTLFDNAGEFGVTDEANSRGLFLALNFTNMSVSLIQEFEPHNTTLSQSQGSVQLQPNGNFLVGWGFMPWSSEYSADGELLWAGQFGIVAFASTGPENQRLLLLWTLPNHSKSNLLSVHASWNGDTRTKKWELLGASDSSGSNTVSLYNQTRSGFETSITINTANQKYDYLAVRAFGAENTPLGVSDFVSTGNGVAALVIGAWRTVLAAVMVVWFVQAI
ncbi:hypothetical protein BT96DRAFT_987257 [Gymnopus androsaceus JB14]|uniref:ASST-domain-containing protein n=1 Tax=Gymnopus androsaceus JB14 TaxID=1447944 RepID=A0A6A4IA62_9AGAR|nr:hypothetical protein BT96DRAFT_987257 [Gymnopus androsaceus JB14]